MVLCVPVIAGGVSISAGMTKQQPTQASKKGKKSNSHSGFRKTILITSNGKLSATTIAVVQRDEESARRFQERRAERRRSIEERKQREEKSSRRGFAFWKK
jgi:hypothetical protein